MQTKSHLNGKTINLTSDNTIIKSTNFNVDKNGNMTCSNAKVTGGKINLQGGTKENPNFEIKNSYGKLTSTPQDIFFNSNRSMSIVMNHDNANASGAILYTDEVGGGLTLGGNNYSGQITLRATDSFDKTHIACYGYMEATAFNNISLADNKKNFERLENALDIIKKTDIYKYNFKNEEETSKKHIGFVIGQNYNYSKEITSKNNDGADIYSLASVCLQAIKEQQEEIELLKQEINKLKGEQ